VAVDMLTGQFADKPIHGQLSRRLVISQTSQLSDNGCLHITDLLHNFYTQNN